MLYGRPDTLCDAVRLYADGMAEYADAELFAACGESDFATAFHLIVLPALVLGRDLMLFQPRQWHSAATAFDGRSTVCLTTPSLALIGARVVPTGKDYSGVCFVPSADGLTVERAERVAAGFPGCAFLNTLGSAETGLLTVSREVRDDGVVGEPLPGKRGWLRDIDEHGVGTLWTAGPDTRIAATGGTLTRAEDGAVSSGHLAHTTPDGGFVLDGRADAPVRIDGVSVDPAEVVATLRGIRGVVDASVSVDRSGPDNRVTVVAVGDVTEGPGLAAAGRALRRPGPARGSLSSGGGACRRRAWKGLR